MPKLEDPTAGGNSYLRPDSDWVTSDITVSTVADQTPIAPGYVVSDETKNGRRTVRFKSDTPIQNFYSIQSARYAIKEAKWNGIKLEVYYHPTHDYNIDLMLDVMKTSMKVFEREFGPYQFRQARMIEFPAVATFAQSFANTIAYSEDIGFLQDAQSAGRRPVEDRHGHLRHRPRNRAPMVGASSAGRRRAGLDDAERVRSPATRRCLVMEEIYGPEQVRKFLNQERDSYLQGRLGENVEEQPLYRVENQQYIHYRKGAMVLYRLKTEIGAAIIKRRAENDDRTLQIQSREPLPALDRLHEPSCARRRAPQHDALISTSSKRSRSTN